MKRISMIIFLLLALTAIGCSAEAEEPLFLSGKIDRIYGADMDWGITLTAENVSSTGLTVVCTQQGGSPTGIELSSGSFFWVEKLDNDSWSELEVLPQEYEIGWTAEAWMIPFNDSVKWDIGWNSFYGELAPGKYRVAKEIMDFRGTGDFDQAIFYAEFEIE